MRKRTLRRRYGRAVRGSTEIRVLSRDVSMGDGPGPVRTHLVAGDRVELGGLAANTDYRNAYRVQRLGEGWTRLGPFALVPISAIAPKKRRR